MNKTWITAHSGCEGRPDNSLEFLDFALSLPVDAVEVGVCRRADGVLVLSHNQPPEAGAPTLTSAFARLAARPAVWMNCNLKEDGLETPVLDAAEHAGVADRLIYSGNVDLGLLREPDGLAGRVCVYLNLERVADLPESSEQAVWEENARLSQKMRSVIARLRGYRFACLNLYYRFCTGQTAAALAEAGIPFSAWTPDEPDMIRTLCRLGAANITTRRPVGALKAREEAAR